MLFCKNEDRIVEYCKWVGMPQFLNDMKLSKDNIPMLEDHISTIDTEKTSFSEDDCKELGIFNIQDLLTACEQKKTNKLLLLS